MKSQLNILRQLQELTLTRDEHSQTGDGSRLGELDKAIEGLQSKLEPIAGGLYSRLYKKSHIVMAAMSNGCCSVCGMQVPTAQSQQVKLAQHMVTCSGCGRILFASEDGAAHNISPRPDRDEIRNGISRFSAEELMLPDMQAKTRDEAIEALSALMEEHRFIKNADALATAAIDRENVLSTAVGGPLAFPHVRGVEGGGLTLAMGVSREGIDWDGEQRVNVVFLSAIPVAVSAFYLRLMSGLVQAFAKQETVDSLLAAKDRKALWKTLVKTTRRTVK